jgi:hypothetical protein
MLVPVGLCQILPSALSPCWRGETFIGWHLASAVGAGERRPLRAVVEIARRNCCVLEMSINKICRRWPPSLGRCERPTLESLHLSLNPALTAQHRAAWAKPDFTWQREASRLCCRYDWIGAIGRPKLTDTMLQTSATAGMDMIVRSFNVPSLLLSAFWRAKTKVEGRAGLGGGFAGSLEKRSNTIMI